MKVDIEGSTANSIPFNFQKLFTMMQLSNVPVSTRELTHSFGWTDIDTIIQHDIQEFSRILIDNLAEKFKKNNNENYMSTLFMGKIRNTIQCIDNDYRSERIEEFYDLSLGVKDIDSIDQSFQQYMETEKLEGSNQYHVPHVGKFNAIKMIKFISLPKILQIHLRRFEYDIALKKMVKVSSHFAFSENIDLSPYVEDGIFGQYVLFGVIVHSGTPSSGHYYSFLKIPYIQEWYKFNYSNV